MKTEKYSIHLLPDFDIHIKAINGMTLRLFLVFSIVLSSFLPCFSQKYDAVVVEYNTDCSVFPLEVVENVTHVIQVNNRNGDDYSIVTIPYSKDLKISDLEAHLEDASGKVVRQLKKSEIIDRNEINGDLYNDRFEKVFQLKHNSYPYRIRYSFTHTRKNYMSITYWSPVRSQIIPTIKATLHVNIPNEIKYSIRIKDISKYSIDTTNAGVKLNFESSYPSPVKDEICSVDDFPFVNILPITFTNRIPGSWESWKDYGDWIYRLNEGLDVLPQSEKTIVANLIQGKTDKIEIVRALYHYMQDHTRYISVMIGIGALQAFPAEYVCRNKYGDCKALTNYLKALLKEAGIDSYYTIVESDEYPDKFYADFPSHQFNHVILMVPLDNDTIWLENTNSLLPMDYVNVNIQNRYGLLIDKTNSKLIKIPALSEREVFESKRLNYNIVKDGSAIVNMSCTYRGYEFEYFLALSSLTEQSDRDLRIRKMMMFDNYEVVDWKIRKSNRDSAFINLDVNLKLNKFLNNIGTDQYFALNDIGIPSFSNPAARTRPVTIPYPVYISDTLVFNLPENYQLKNQITPINIQSPYGSFELSVSTENNMIKAVKTFKLKAGEYLLDAYPEFYKFIESARKNDKAKIVIKQINL